MSHGASIGEAIHNLEAARELFLSTLQDLNHCVPEPKENLAIAGWVSEPATKAVAEIPPMLSQALRPSHA